MAYASPGNDFTLKPFDNSATASFVGISTQILGKKQKKLKKNHKDHYFRCCNNVEKKKQEA